MIIWSHILRKIYIQDYWERRNHAMVSKYEKILMSIMSKLK